MPLYYRRKKQAKSSTQKQSFFETFYLLKLVQWVGLSEGWCYTKKFCLLQPIARMSMCYFYRTY